MGCLTDFQQLGARFFWQIVVRTMSLPQKCNVGGSCIIWVLGLLFAITAVDTLPDPPAVSPRTIRVACLKFEMTGGVHGRRLISDLSISSPLQVRWGTFTSTFELNLFKDRDVLTEFATDPSPPPVVSSRLNLYLPRKTPSGGSLTERG
jgi:hypothetical protein